MDDDDLVLVLANLLRECNDDPALCASIADAVKEIAMIQKKETEECKNDLKKIIRTIR